MRRLLTSLAAAALLAVCTLPAQAGPVLYLKNRGNDLLDVVRLRLGLPSGGKGVGIKARATCLAQAGYVYFDGTYVGLDRRGVGMVEERRNEFGVSLLYASYNEMEGVWGNHFLKADTPWSDIHDRRIVRNLPHWDDGRRRPLSVGAEVMTPLLGVDAGVYPSEALDFALGLLLIDMHKDDEKSVYATPHGLPTTPPGPQVDAPFAQRKAELEELKAELLRRELEAQGQLGSEEAMSVEFTPTTEEYPEAVTDLPAPDSLTSDEADALHEELEQQPQPTEEQAAEPAPQDEAMEPAPHDEDEAPGPDETVDNP